MLSNSTIGLTADSCIPGFFREFNRLTRKLRRIFKKIVYTMFQLFYIEEEARRKTDIFMGKLCNSIPSKL